MLRTQVIENETLELHVLAFPNQNHGAFKKKDKTYKILTVLYQYGIYIMNSLWQTEQPPEDQATMSLDMLIERVPINYLRSITLWTVFSSDVKVCIKYLFESWKHFRELGAVCHIPNTEKHCEVRSYKRTTFQNKGPRARIHPSTTHTQRDDCTF